MSRAIQLPYNETVLESNAVLIESWRKTLPRASGTKAKLRNLMPAIFKHAMRWEFFHHNPMSVWRQAFFVEIIPFWRNTEPFPRAHPWLIYSELMNSTDARAHEAASARFV